ncbi:CZB domain-containing protein [Citrobacter amalonaticus]|nr:CZB domain-containing protein [Citrobacter amalonaticus]
MLTQEQHHIIMEHMRHSMMNKAVQVHYTAEKCFRLREGLIRSATRYREDAALMTPLQNRQYRLINSIAADREGVKDATQERQLLSRAREQYGLIGMMQQQLNDIASGLMLSADTLLFTLLKAQHYQWRDRLYMAVLTEQPGAALAEENACPLGQWLCTEGGRRFCTQPGFRALREAHHQMHVTAALLFDRPLTEMPAGVLKARLQHTEDASQHLMGSLDALEKMVSSLYPDGRDSPCSQKTDGKV